MSLKENLRNLRIMNNLTLDEVAHKVGVTKPTLQRYESGVISNVPPSDKIEKLAEVYNTTPAYLMGWSNEMRKPRSIVKIPVLGKVSAGLPIEAFEEILDYEEIDEALALTGEFFALRISGLSMEPKISPGDIVIVRKQNDIESGKIGIVLVNGQDATCKKIVKHENGISLVSFNPSYPPIFYTNEEVISKPVTIIGKVIELRAKL